MRPLDVERDLQVPEVVVLESGAVARRRRRWWRATLHANDVEARRYGRRAVGRRIAGPAFAAEVRQPEGGVEDAEIRSNGGGAERVDDDDRLALTPIPCGVQDGVVVRVRHRRRVKAPASDGVACGLARRSAVVAEVLEVADRRPDQRPARVAPLVLRGARRGGRRDTRRDRAQRENYPKASHPFSS